MVRSRLLAAALAVPSCLALAAATAAPSDDGAAKPGVVEIRTTDYEFHMPDQIPAGAVTLRLVNDGKEPHHVQVMRLKDGKTMEDFGKAMEAMMAPDAPSHAFPAWIELLGGPNPPPPGGAAETTVVLRPGNYVFLCFVPSPDGTPHVAKGMVKMVTAVPSEGSPQLPAAEIAMLLTDYDFTISKPLKAGRATIRVKNTSSQPHEVVMAKLNDGTTAEQFLHWIEKPNGPPPGMMVGGVAGISGTAANNMTVDLTPGRYALICFFPDEKDGRPHFMHGMIKEITVAS